MKQKGLRKLVSMILAVVMVLAMSITGFAANIEIQNAKVGETYTAYQIFTATQSGNNITYYISENSDYYSHIVAMSNLATAEQQSDDDYTELFILVGPNSDGLYQVTWNGDGDTTNDVTTGEDDSAIIAYLTSLGAKGADTYSVTATENSDGSVSATISGLDAGYYFVTTSTGSVVSIGTTGTSEIKEKNGTPTPTKTVSDTENGEGTESNTAGIGDPVYYTIEITDADQIVNLVVTDTLSAGLTLNEDVVVKVGEEIASASVTDLDGNVTANDYTVTYGTYSADNGTTLTIEFEDSYLAALSSNATITITYSAVVNENAVISGEGNGNEVELSYGNGSTSTSDYTTTMVYDFDLNKTDGTNTIGNAEFSLADSVNSLIYFVAVNGGYRVATQDEIDAYEASQVEGYEGDQVTEVTTTISAGSVNISGLDAGTYTLTETKAPDGYNQLDSAITVVIDEEGNATVGEGSNGNGSVVNSVITVVNNAGSLLPSTGGMGTTIFYIVGGVLVLGAAVLFVTKKRLGNEN